MKTRMPRLPGFAARVLRDFFLRNHGLLLTGAVAHSMILSLIPLSAVLIAAFSNFFDQGLLMDTLTSEVSLIAPGFAPVLTEAMEGFLRNRQLVGGVGLLFLISLSSVAFRVLEDAIAIIFHRPLPTLKRKFWLSALMPYLFVLIVAAGLILITSANALIDARSRAAISIPGLDPLLEHHLGTILYVIGVLGQILLFTLFYKIMPVARISFKTALAGGVTAALLWELVRHLVVAYFTRISIVNVLYGSMATIVIVLLTMEAVALILLLGAQVIANLQGNASAGLRWHDDPDTL
jgi:YihY family inner membrane protein